MEPLARSYNWRDNEPGTPVGEWPWTAKMESWKDEPILFMCCWATMPDRRTMESVLTGRR